MNYLSLIHKYKKIMCAGFLLTFFSGFGQSFFLSNYTLKFITELNISQTQFGTLYALMTMFSGFLLIWFGSLLDRVDAIKYTFFAILGFSGSCLLMYKMNSIYTLGLAIFGLRFCGQGLFSHISSTVIARGFTSLRGRALSLTNMGHPFSEAILPILAVYLMARIGWRESWLIYCLLICTVLIPLIPFLFKGPVETLPDKKIELASAAIVKTFSKFPYFLKGYTFWYLSLGMLIPGSTLTGLFLYHSVLATERGWTMTWIATNFVWFAVSQFIFSLVGGALVDRYGSKKMFTFYLLPFCVSFLILSFGGLNPLCIPLYLFFAGITIGFGSPIKTALWAEVYGVKQIASLRSWAGAIGILGTAISPPLLGYVLDSGLGFGFFLNTAIAFTILYICGFLIISEKIKTS